ncbi:hypothetical protein OGZ37_03860 [Lactococcus lactis]|uniref:hypothetical protein n=1 Tax=Lactococcus lactis TaxID=1358 RepID=UPI002418213A|nr:hypothetical protein [Lactococcus lactis]MDG4965713.1 hypothetical protein [Lactococcus lactis]
MKQITRNEVKELNSNKVYGFILSDGEFIVNEPDVVREQAKSADKRFCYGDFDEFTFDDDLKSLAYVVVKDDSKVSGSTTVEVVGELTEPQEYEPQQTLKSIIKGIQDMTFKAHELSEGDPDVFGALVSGELDRLLETLGLTELSITAEVEENLPENTLKAQIQDLYSLNDSMITADPNHVPKYTDGTIITLSDLVDMNVQALDNIAELIGFELDE